MSGAIKIILSVLGWGMLVLTSAGHFILGLISRGLGGAALSLDMIAGFQFIPTVFTLLTALLFRLSGWKPLPALALPLAMQALVFVVIVTAFGERVSPLVEWGVIVPCLLIGAVVVLRLYLRAVAGVVRF